jgi:hypothetical protein
MFTVQDDFHFLRVELDGHVDRNDLFDAQDALMRHPKYHYKNALWVIKDGFICGFSQIDLSATIERIKNFWHHDATKQKSAFFASNSFRYTLIKFFCEEAEYKELPFTMMPFMNLQDAEAWLLEDSEVRCC